MKRQWIVDKPSRIDDFAYQKGINKKMLKAIKMKGDILVDGIHQSVRYLLKPGEVITFVYPVEENHMLPYEYPLKIVYEDEYLLVIDKEKGMPCIPTRAHPYHTLANALTAYYQKVNLFSTIHLVNRLDKETAGLLIVAKYREIHDLMMKDLKHIYREYQAHVEGKVEQGIVDLPIYRENKDMKRIIDERGKSSRTHYQCLHYQKGISLVRFVLETGRTHQIRVHMSALGHPLIGDEIYGNQQGTFDLTSVMVAFIHPVTKRIITIRKRNEF